MINRSLSLLANLHFLQNKLDYLTQKFQQFVFMTWYYSILCLIIDYFLGTGYETKKVVFEASRCLNFESLNQSSNWLFFLKNNKVENIGDKRSDTFFFFTTIFISANGFNESFQNWTRNRCLLIRDLNLMTWLHRYGTQNICVLVPNINLISL